MYTFLKALDEKRSNPWCSRCQTLVWKKSSRRATSAHWGNFWVALLRGTIPVQIKVWWSDHPWRLLYSSRAFRRYIILGVTPLNSKFQKFDNVRPLPGVTQQVANNYLDTPFGKLLAGNYLKKNTNLETTDFLQINYLLNPFST